MRRLSFLAVLAAGAGAVAAPARARVGWADWIGDWRGKLHWSSCTIDGEPSASLPFDATDGAVGIDLTPAGGALEKMPLVEDDGGWVGRQADVTVHLTRSSADTLELAVDLDSGCRVRAKLRRASTGIPACDRLAAWARIEARCTRLTRPPLENTARLVRQRSAWSRVAPAERPKVAAQCEARAAKVEAELVDAGCAPDPDPAVGLRAASCVALRASAAKLGRCPNVPPDVRAAFARRAGELTAAARTADTAALPIVERQCRDLREQITTSSRQVGCPP